MAEFKKGQTVRITAAHLAGIKAKVLFPAGSDEVIVAITDDQHPSGHSQRGTVVCLQETELEADQAAAGPGPAPALGNRTLPAIETLG